ncbi:GNAT family N-acetyltransferase [Granulicella cerasi]|uniref:GNAT family N-acetyltransferase n=1 Tax=Granulicella cerasi TaxID=741063 RepID=A0ABW1Z9E2_9BACT|nr:GNAT family N-acetyltransferase [Granulicella cerasi]
MAHAVHIERLVAMSDEAFALLNEYYEAIQVVVRDTRTSLDALLADERSAVWLARVDGAAVGCVVLRPLPALGNACECKRLYVRGAARGMRVATLLMDALETFARAAGYSAVYLDSKDDLKPAIALYESRGYEPCERYNDNPQATVFLRKSLA